MLPLMDGWRVIENARSEGIGTPIVVVSARGSEEAVNGPSAQLNNIRSVPTKLDTVVGHHWRTISRHREIEAVAYVMQQAPGFNNFSIRLGHPLLHVRVFCFRKSGGTPASTGLFDEALHAAFSHTKDGP